MQLQEGVHPYHMQKEHALSPADYQSRDDFTRQYVHQNAASPDFGAHVLFTNENTFTHEGVLISTTHPHLHQRARMPPPSFILSVVFRKCWAEILHEKLVDPDLLPHRLDGESYNTFLREVLPELLRSLLKDYTLKYVNCTNY